MRPHAESRGLAVRAASPRTALFSGLLGAVLDAIAEVIPDRPMTVCGDRVSTFAQSADRMRRLANFLAGRGFGVHREREALDRWECGQDRVALIMHNDLYPDMVIGCLKARTVPVNVNHYYTPREVSELLDYVQPQAVIYHRSLGAKFADVLPPASAGLLISVDDASSAPELPRAITLEDALAQGDTDRDITPSPDDLIMICTGGTTGRPKGVLWRQCDTYVVSMNGDDHSCAEEIHEKVRNAGPPWFAVSPLMHAAGMWTAFAAILNGLTVVLYDSRTKFDPRTVLETAEREKIGLMTMVGDAYAGPLVEELRRRPYDLSSLFAVGTGGAATNPKHQQALMEILPQITVINGYGSSETGNVGFGRSQRGSEKGTFELRPGALVLSDDCTRFLQPGEPEVGWVARAGRIPIGYFDDPEATRKTFPEVEGQRVVISGDRGSARGGRHPAPVRSRFASGEHRRREGVRRGGRRSLAGSPGYRRRPGGGSAERAVGPGSRRCGRVARGCRSRARVAVRALHIAAGAVQGAEGVHLRRTGPSARQWQGGLSLGENSSNSTRVALDLTLPTSGDDMTHKAIDCLVNVHFGETEQQPTWMLKVRDDYFKGPESMFAPVDLSELLDEMDEQGVAKAILMDNLAKPSTTARKFVEAKPDRFALAMGGVNLLRPIPSLRELSAVVNHLPVAYAVVGPSFWGDGQYPPSDAVYYPLYTKCAELGLPLCINTGLPGPPIPGEVQNPIHLDRVCVRFPELKLCMIHGADPWWDVAIRLLIKYSNLRLMTSAWSPKRLPESLLHYMRTRGKDKVIYASDWPVLKTASGPRSGGARPAARGARELSLQQCSGVLLRGR